IACCTHRYFKLEIFVTAVWRMHAHIVIHSRRTEVWTSEAIVQCALGTNRSNANSSIHEDPVASEQVLEFFQHFWIFTQELLEFLECDVVEISFEATNAADVRSKSRSADFFPDLIDEFAVLHHVEEASVCAAVHTNNRIANEVVGDSCQFHYDDAEIVNTLGSLNAEKFLAGDVPAHVVDGSRTIIQPVSKRSDLVQWPALCNLFEGPVNVTN